LQLHCFFTPTLLLPDLQHLLEDKQKELGGHVLLLLLLLLPVDPKNMSCSRLMYTPPSSAVPATSLNAPASAAALLVCTAFLLTPDGELPA
jgi:hypothetical protein